MGRHRPIGLGGRRRSLRTPLSVLAVVVLVGITAIAVRVMSADANGCSSNGVRLSVAAAPEIAPAVQDAATAWAQTDPEVNGKCIQVDVRAAPPAELAGSLAARSGGHIDVAARPAPTPDEADIPAVWIPDSTSWLGRVSAVDRSAFASSTPSVAMSPIVFAVPASLAASKAQQLSGPGGKGLLEMVLADAQEAISQKQPPKLPIGIVDPRRDTASLGGAMLLRDAVVTDESKLPSLIALYRLIYQSRAEDVAGLQQAFGQGVKVAPMAEHTVINFNATNPSAPLTAVALDAGGSALDYPYATLSGRPREVEAAAAKFRAALTGSQYRTAFAERGFRDPDGTPGTGFPVGNGVTAQTSSAGALDNPERIAQTLGLWSAANAPSRALALIDVSSSMGLPLDTGTRMGVLQQSAIAGLQLFTNTSSLGLWTYNSKHTELKPIMELTEANRKALNASILGVPPTADPDSSLFVTVRDAYRMMTETHSPEVANRLIIFTDGRNTTGDIKSLEQLNRELDKIAVVTKPIKVTLIGIGHEVDMAELKEIARMVDGLATQIVDPGQIRSVFLNALLA